MESYLAGDSINAIAVALKCHRSTVYRELKRNGTPLILPRKKGITRMPLLVLIRKQNDADHLLVPIHLLLVPRYS